MMDYGFFVSHKGGFTPIAHNIFPEQANNRPDFDTQQLSPNNIGAVFDETGAVFDEKSHNEEDKSRDEEEKSRDVRPSRVRCSR